MANKTIAQLDAITSVNTSENNLLVTYDVENNVTNKITVGNILKTNLAELDNSNILSTISEVSSSLAGQIGNINTLLGNSTLTTNATTITGAINQINTYKFGIVHFTQGLGFPSADIHYASICYVAYDLFDERYQVLDPDNPAYVIKGIGNYPITSSSVPFIIPPSNSNVYAVLIMGRSDYDITVNSGNIDTTEMTCWYGPSPARGYKILGDCSISFVDNT